jgi:hypothetical protein
MAVAAPQPAGVPFPFQPLMASTDQFVGTAFYPDDPGTSGISGGWQQLQWNFDGRYGVNAPQAWGNLNADGRPGGAGVTVAVLDTGVAYADHGRYMRSPDFTASEFVAGYDFISNSPYPEDRNGHGTQVAGTIAEATDNGVGVTGLAYGVRLMPVRVLNAQGNGSATTIARGIYFAVRHHAQIINLSLEFDAGTISAARIPQLIQAIDYAHDRNVLVVAAAGNESMGQISYPAKAPYVLAVGTRARRARRRRRRGDSRRRQLPAAGGWRERRHLPGDIRQHQQPQPTPVRHPERLLRNIDGSSARQRGGGARDRQRRARPAPDSGSDHRAARSDGDTARAERTRRSRLFRRWSAQRGRGDDADRLDRIHGNDRHDGDERVALGPMPCG